VKNIIFGFVLVLFKKRKIKDKNEVLNVRGDFGKGGG
jgi:hypothetical protein